MDRRLQTALCALIALAGVFLEWKWAAAAAIVCLCVLTYDAMGQAETDSLTALKNRRCLDRLSRGRYARKKKLGVIYFDLDDLKQTNDQKGHGAGDARLKAFAAILSGAEGDAFRIGGDEFLLVMDQISRESLESAMADLLAQAASIGVSAGCAWGSDVQALIQAADQAMLAGKG